MNIPSLEKIEVSGKKVIIRADLDVGEELADTDVAKLSTIKETINYLSDKGSRLILIGHRGRPEGKRVDELSLKPVAEKLAALLNKKIGFVNEAGNAENEIAGLSDQIIMVENLRFDPREELNDEGFAGLLAAMGEVYVNEAFSASHREHASVVGIPKLLPHAAGYHFLKEVENLSRVLEAPKRPVVVILSGVKKDKLDYLPGFKKFADKILIAGKLPEYIDNDEQFDAQDPKLVIASLIPDKEDITINSIEKFENEIKKAGTIVVSGPIGKFEDEGHRQATLRVFTAVAGSQAYKVAGGGDTEQAIRLLGLEEKFDWISVGGGASLDFLANGTLPGIEALVARS